MSHENELLDSRGPRTGMERLIEMGADVNYSEIDPDLGYTPLIHAAGSGEIQVCVCCSVLQCVAVYCSAL